MRDSMHRRKAHDWDEGDVHSKRGRRYLCWVQRPGAVRKVKTRARRRERRNAKRDLRDT